MQFWKKRNSLFGSLDLDPRGKGRPNQAEGIGSNVLNTILISVPIEVLVRNILVPILFQIPFQDNNYIIYIIYKIVYYI